MHLPFQSQYFYIFTIFMHISQKHVHILRKKNIILDFLATFLSSIATINKKQAKVHF